MGDMADMYYEEALMQEFCTELEYSSVEEDYERLGNEIPWHTRNGRSIRVCDMSLNHVINAYKYLLSKDPCSPWLRIFKNEMDERKSRNYGHKQ